MFLLNATFLIFIVYDIFIHQTKTFLKKMELVNTRNNKREFVQEENIVSGIYHFQYKLDLSQSPEKIEADKIFISKLKYQIALYDIKSDNLYLIDKSQVYNKVFNENYRFITQKYYDEFLEKKQKKLEEKYKDHPFKANHMNKYDYFLNFLQNFNLEVYFRTYIDVLYNVDELGGELTFKEKNDYAPMKVLSHVKPYYTKTEILYYGLNNKIISSLIVSNDEIQLIYEELQKYEMDFRILLDHYNYIIKNNVYELIQYYSLQSYKTINGYLRFSKDRKRFLLNKLINRVNEVIFNVNKESKKMERDFYVYRFVSDDSYIKNLDINDTFTEKGFLSTTRNPFYKTKDDSTFGWTLLKIKVPKDYPFLCIETVSMIPFEEEVIFPTNTTLKLLNKDTNCEYYHTDEKVQKKIKTKYEFEIVENNKIEKLQEKNTEKITQENYLIYKNIECYYEKSETLSDYTDFYVCENDKGIVIFCFIDFKLLMIIEIYGSYMYINYTFIYKGKITYLFDYFTTFDDFVDYINFLCKKLNVEIKTIKLYGGYINCNKDQINYYYKGGVFCFEIFYYLKYNKENSYYLNSQFIKPNYELSEYRKLYNYKLTDIVQRIDKNGRYSELYYLHSEYLKNGGKNNVIDFYLYLVSECCYFIQALQTTLIDYIEDRKIKFDTNIFNKLVYTIDFEGYNQKRKIRQNRITLKKNKKDKKK